MPPTNLNAAIEALLFSSDQPLPIGLLSEALDTPEEDLLGELHALGEACAARAAGVELREIAGGWMLVSTPAQSEWVGRLLRGKKKMRLSRAGLETMAIIAYKQPVTKSEVEAIRGVDSSGVLATLLERNLVTIRGRSKVVGRPLLYGTTQEFLDYFGLRDLAELPRPEELRALVAAREPEQLEMMELEVVSRVASTLAAAESTTDLASTRHNVLPLDAEPPTEDELEEDVLQEKGDEPLDEDEIDDDLDEDEEDEDDDEVAEDDDDEDDDEAEDDEFDGEDEDEDEDDDEADEDSDDDETDEAGDDDLIDDEEFDEVEEGSDGFDEDDDDFDGDLEDDEDELLNEDDAILGDDDRAVPVLDGVDSTDESDQNGRGQR